MDPGLATMLHPRTAGLVLLGTLTLLAATLLHSGAPVRADLNPQDPPVPVVVLSVRVPATTAAGQELVYHLCVENCSAAAAHHVVLRNPLPAGARFVRSDPGPSAREPELLWTLGTLEAGQRRDIVLVLASTGTEDIKNCARVQFEHGQCVRTRIARAELKLRKSGPGQAVLQDTLNYQLTVTNTGDAEATGVKVTDTLPPGLEAVGGKNPLTWDIGTLAPGQSKSVEYQAAAKASGRLCNRASAVAASGLTAEAESCVTIGEPRLTLTMVGPPRRYLNMNAVYQLTVANPGTVPLGNITITNLIPTKTTFVSASNGGRLAGNEITWSIGNLNSGATRTVELALRSQEAGKVCNRAVVRAERGLVAQAEACTDFIGVSALLMEVVDTDDPVEVGAETSYVISVRNQGTVAATNLRIEASVPEEMDINRVTGPTDHRKDGRRIIFQPLTLQAQSDARYVVYVRAIKPGDVRFKVDLNADVLTSGPVHEEESTTIYTDVPGAAPSGDASNGRSRRPGGAP
jgi:uncharacterized repeat protein (TIGR01451 family)